MAYYLTGDRNYFREEDHELEMARKAFDLREPSANASTLTAIITGRIGDCRQGQGHDGAAIRAYPQDSRTSD
jgi:hypothetical protein